MKYVDFSERIANLQTQTGFSGNMGIQAQCSHVITPLPLLDTSPLGISHLRYPQLTHSLTHGHIYSLAHSFSIYVMLYPFPFPSLPFISLPFPFLFHSLRRRIRTPSTLPYPYPYLIPIPSAQ